MSEYVLLNEFNETTEELEQMLINDLVKIIPAEKKSTHKGVYWHKKSGRMKNGKWEVKIRINGKYKSLGRYDNEIDAIKTYDNYVNNNGKNTNKQILKQ